MNKYKQIMAEKQDELVPSIDFQTEIEYFKQKMENNMQNKVKEVQILNENLIKSKENNIIQLKKNKKESV